MKRVIGIFLLVVLLNACQIMGADSSTSGDNPPPPPPAPDNEAAKYLAKAVDFSKLDSSLYLVPANPTNNRIEVSLKQDVVEKLQQEFKINTFKITINAINSSSAKDTITDSCVLTNKLSCTLLNITTRKLGVYNASILVNDVVQTQPIKLSFANRSIDIVDPNKDSIHFLSREYSFDVKMSTDVADESFGVNIQANGGYSIVRISDQTGAEVSSCVFSASNRKCTVYYKVLDTITSRDSITIIGDKNVTNRFYLQYSTMTCAKTGYYLNSNPLSKGDKVDVYLPNDINVMYCGQNESSSKAVVYFSRKAYVPSSLDIDSLIIEDINSIQVKDNSGIDIAPYGTFHFNLKDKKLTSMAIALKGFSPPTGELLENITLNVINAYGYASANIYDSGGSNLVKQVVSSSWDVNPTSLKFKAFNLNSDQKLSVRMCELDGTNCTQQLSGATVKLVQGSDTFDLAKNPAIIKEQTYYQIYVSHDQLDQDKEIVLQFVLVDNNQGILDSLLSKENLLHVQLKKPRYYISPSYRKVVAAREYSTFYIKVTGETGDVRLVDLDYKAGVAPNLSTQFVQKTGFDKCKAGATAEQCAYYLCANYGYFAGYVDYGGSLTCNLGNGINDKSANICKCSVGYNGSLADHQTCVFMVRAYGKAADKPLRIAALDDSNDIMRSRILELQGIESYPNVQIKSLSSSIESAFTRIDKSLFTEEAYKNGSVFAPDFLTYAHLNCSKIDDHTFEIRNFSGKNLIGTDSSHQVVSLPGDFKLVLKDNCSFRDDSGNCVSKYGLPANDSFTNEYVLPGADISYSSISRTFCGQKVPPYVALLRSHKIPNISAIGYDDCGWQGADHKTIIKANHVFANNNNTVIRNGNNTDYTCNYTMNGSNILYSGDATGKHFCRDQIPDFMPMALQVYYNNDDNHYIYLDKQITVLNNQVIRKYDFDQTP